MCFSSAASQLRKSVVHVSQTTITVLEDMQEDRLNTLHNTFTSETRIYLLAILCCWNPITDSGHHDREAVAEIIESK